MLVLSVLAKMWYAAGGTNIQIALFTRSFVSDTAQHSMPVPQL